MLEDPAIRPQHCSFRMAGGAGGANHITLLRDDPDADVMVNTARLGVDEVLQSGDQITVGGLTFLFQTAAAPSASRRRPSGDAGAREASSGSRGSQGMMGLSAFQKSTVAGHPPPQYTPNEQHTIHTIHTTSPPQCTTP